MGTCMPTYTSSQVLHDFQVSHFLILYLSVQPLTGPRTFTTQQSDYVGFARSADGNPPLLSIGAMVWELYAQ